MPRFQCLLYWNVDKKQWRSESYLKGLSKSFYLYITELHRWLVQCFVVVVVQLLSRVWLFVTPWTADTKHLWPPPSPRVCPNSCLLSRWCYLTILSSAAHFTFCLQSFPAWRFFPKSQLFASGGQSIRSFSFSISPSNEYSGLISFRMDWLELLAVQGTFKTLLQHHTSKESIVTWDT